MVSKHMAGNIPILRYLELIELLNIDTNVIMKNLENFFVVKMLNTDDLMHFGSDSASVMLGIYYCISNVILIINNIR